MPRRPANARNGNSCMQKKVRNHIDYHRSWVKVKRRQIGWSNRCRQISLKCRTFWKNTWPCSRRSGQSSSFRSWRNTRNPSKKRPNKNRTRREEMVQPTRTQWLTVLLTLAASPNRLGWANIQPKRHTNRIQWWAWANNCRASPLSSAISIASRVQWRDWQSKSAQWEHNAWRSRVWCGVTANGKDKG